MFLRTWWLQGEADAGEGGAAAGGATAGGDAGAAGAGGAGSVLDAGKGDAGTDAGKGAGDAGKGAGDDKGYWPQDWQKRFAGDDEKELKQVSRYASPEAIWKKARALEARLSSGELKTALPKNAKPEEVAQWRKDNGLPESPDKYDLKDLKIDDADKPRIDEFLKSAHSANMTPEQVKAAIAWQQSDSQNRLTAQAEKDNQDRIAALDALNGEWGTGFRRNVQVVEGFLQTFPDSVRDLLKGGRLADGTGIFNHPDVLRGFVALALQVNPAATIVPSGTGDPMKGIDEAIAAGEKFMREHRSEYNKSEAKQKELRDLYEARERMKDRKAA